jgi:hypothetical protein
MSDACPLSRVTHAGLTRTQLYGRWSDQHKIEQQELFMPITVEGSKRLRRVSQPLLISHDGTPSALRVQQRLDERCSSKRSLYGPYGTAPRMVYLPIFQDASYWSIASSLYASLNSAIGADLDAGVGMSAGRRKRRDFHRQPVAPSIFTISDCSNLVPQLAIGLTFENTRRCVDLQFSSSNCYARIASDVLDPSGGFPRFGEQIESLAANHEPNLDLARQARRTSNRGQVKELFICDTLEIHRCHEKRLLAIA